MLIGSLILGGQKDIFQTNDTERRKYRVGDGRAEMTPEIMEGEHLQHRHGEMVYEDQHCRVGRYPTEALEARQRRISQFGGAITIKHAQEERPQEDDECGCRGVNAVTH